MDKRYPYQYLRPSKVFNELTKYAPEFAFFLVDYAKENYAEEMAIFLIMKTRKLGALRDPKYQRHAPDLKTLNECAPMLISGFYNFDNAFTQEVKEKYTKQEPYKTHYQLFLQLGYTKYVQHLRKLNNTFIIKRGKKMAHEHIEQFMQNTLNKLLATASQQEKETQERYKHMGTETCLRTLILDRLLALGTETQIKSPEQYLLAVALHQLDQYTETKGY